MAGGKRNPPNLELTGRSGVELRTRLNARSTVKKINIINWINHGIDFDPEEEEE